MKKTAILLGATGLTGSTLLNKLLHDRTIEKVKVFSRRTTGVSHPKLEEHIISLFELKKHNEEFYGNVVFCCIGTTKANTPDKNKYRKIDHGIPVSAAKLCKENKIETFIVMSSMGTDVESSVFYNKVKGEMERDVLSQEIPNTYILQPSLIAGKRDEKRLGERIMKGVMKVINPLLPKKYQSIHPDTIASAMKALMKKGFDETVITSDKIKEIANVK